MSGDLMVAVETPLCMMCQRTSTLQIREEGLRLWKAGQLIQHALPELSADEREMLLTGMHPDCWVNWASEPQPIVR